LNVCGIDPGLAGARAIVSEEDGFLLVDDLPVHRLVAAKRTRGELDLASLRRILVMNPIRHFVIERVSSRPGEDLLFNAQFRLQRRVLYGLITGLQLLVTRIPPIRWQRLVGVGPSLGAARQRETQLYSDAAEHLTRKRDAGRADAILIARARLMMLRQPVAAA
jgi:crossover junction endodeoxyribonuclease RuvC